MDLFYVALTSLFSLTILFILAKLSGHRQIAQLDVFDYVSGITIGSIAAELATELEAPLKPLIAMLVYGFATVLLNIFSSKWPRARKYLNGTPTIIFHDGKLYRKNMAKTKLDLSEFLIMCRQSGYFDLSAIRTAVYETNGKMSFLPVSDRRPATPADHGLKPPEEAIYTEVIMDGRVLHENLQRMGLNLKWLENQLRAQGYTTPAQIFLGLCDKDRKLSLYKNEQHD